MFINLHSHSRYSDLDGISKIPELVEKIKKDPSSPNVFTITDHGRISGWPEAMKIAKKEGMKFLPGVEGYVSLPEGDPKANSRKAKYYHLTIFARNEAGVKFIYKLFKNSKKESRKIVFDRDLLYSKESSDSLVILSGCVGGELASYTVGVEDIKNPDMVAAENYVKEAVEIWGDSFFLEIGDHKDQLEKEHTVNVIKLSQKLGVKLVATCDSHYTNVSDHNAHQLYIKSSKFDDWGVSQGDYSSMGGDEALTYFTGLGYHQDSWREAIENTLLVSDLIEDDIALPHTAHDEQIDIRGIVDEAFKKKRIGTSYEEESRARVETEMAVIVKKEYQRYFYIVYSLLNYLRSIGVIVGPGRGSGAGSEVAYLMGITGVDPLKYGLIFERFLNYERDSPPDFDIDFQSYVNMPDGRTLSIKDAVRDWAETYEIFANTSLILTLTTEGASSALKGMMRAADVPYMVANKITTGLMPEQLNKCIQNPDLLESTLDTIQVDLTPQIADAFVASEHIIGTVKGDGIHASGVLMSNEEIPVDGEGISLFDYKSLEDIGFIKYDILAVDTLGHIKEALNLMPEELSNRYYDNDGDLIWDEQDPAVFKQVMKSTLTNQMVFQLSSPGMNVLIQGVKPQSIEDLALISAMYRPGPLESGLPDVYIARKNKTENEDALSLAEIVIRDALSLDPKGEKELGVLIYQEQAMKLAQILSGFTLNESDHLRAAIGKKDDQKTAEVGRKFIKQFKPEYGDKKVAEAVWSYIVPFGHYAFNKSHAVAYSMISYVTAKLMTYDPGYYLAAIKRLGAGKSNKIVNIASASNVKVKAARWPATLSTHFDGDVLWLSPMESKNEWSDIHEFIADKSLGRMHNAIINFGYWGDNVTTILQKNSGDSTMSLFSRPNPVTAEDIDKMKQAQIKSIGMYLNAPIDKQFSQLMKMFEQVVTVWEEASMNMDKVAKQRAWTKISQMRLADHQQWTGNAYLVVSDINKYKNIQVDYQIGDQVLTFVIRKWNKELWEFFADRKIGETHKVTLAIVYNKYTQAPEFVIKDAKDVNIR